MRRGSPSGRQKRRKEEKQGKQEHVTPAILCLHELQHWSYIEALCLQGVPQLKAPTLTTEHKDLIDSSPRCFKVAGLQISASRYNTRNIVLWLMIAKPLHVSLEIEMKFE
eukprot:661583-Pelagomonas_calceolata.AAC.6